MHKPLVRGRKKRAVALLFLERRVRCTLGAAFSGGTDEGSPLGGDGIGVAAAFSLASSAAIRAFSASFSSRASRAIP